MLGVGRESKGSDGSMADGPAEKQWRLGLDLAGVDGGVGDLLVGDKVDGRCTLVGVLSGPLIQVPTHVRRDEMGV